MSDVYQKYICKKKKNRNNNPYNALINHQRPAGGVGWYLQRCHWCVHCTFIFGCHQ